MKLAPVITIALAIAGVLLVAESCREKVVTTTGNSGGHVTDKPNIGRLFR